MKQEYLELLGIEKEEDLDKVNWTNISRYQKLSEDFIEKFQDKVYWPYISEYQKLSEDFIEKFQDKVDWSYISKYQKLSDDFIGRHNLTISDNNWLYEDNKYKMEKIKDCGLYEIDGDYVIAYKSTRNNGYSAYNYQYQYEVGGIYESYCDYNIDNANSFGFSAWTKENALEYYSKGELYKVRVHIDDLGALVHDGGKLRCRKIEILGLFENESIGG